MRDRRLQRGEASRDRRIPEELMISRLVPDGPPLAMYDLGVGCFSEWRTLKIMWPSMQLFGCEPNLETYNELLPMFGGKLSLLAISDENGFADLALTSAAEGGSTLKPGMGKGRQLEWVLTMTLDRYDALCGSPDRILLWMDIEGSELDAIRGGGKLLSSGRVHWLNVETRDADGREGHPTTADINAALAVHGYVPVHRYNVQGAYPEAPGDMIYFKQGVVPLLPCNGGVQLP